MKTVVVLDPNTELKDENLQTTRITIDEKEFLFSIVDIPYSLDVDVDDDCVMVKINAFSCNYRDKKIFELFNSKCAQNHSSDSFFFSYFGSDFVGEVLKIGKNVKAFVVGDRVIPDHSYPWKSDNLFGGVVTNIASKRIQVFRESFLAKVPDSMSDSQAASFPLTSLTANSIVSKAHINTGDKVLVTSVFSNTSIGCLEFLRHFKDLEIYALSTHKRDLDGLAHHFQIRQVFSPDDLSNYDLRPKLKFDVIIDPFADIHIELLSTFLNFNSRYISCGITNLGAININTFDVLVKFIVSNSVFIANCLGKPENLKEALAAYNRGEYQIYVDSVYKEEQLSSFILRTFNEKHFGKVVFLYD